MRTIKVSNAILSSAANWRTDSLIWLLIGLKRAGKELGNRNLTRFRAYQTSRTFLSLRVISVPRYIIVLHSRTR